MPVDIQKMLEGAGLGGGALDRIRLSHGVVGKLSTVIGIAFAVLAIAALRLIDPLYILVVVGSVVFLAIIYIVGVLWYSHKHPYHALLEGAELIKLREMEMAAKNIPFIHEGVAIEAPVHPIAIENRGRRRSR